MLHRAPKGLGPRGNFAHPGNNAIAVAAIDAIQFLQTVEICQMMPINADMI
jgi:hypothetical protein